ncbi:MAG: AMP-binding protein, partial [Actinobacteria bacterium]|nr:AMP-binding protein [Actinomycetota bacterium]
MRLIRRRTEAEGRPRRVAAYGLDWDVPEFFNFTRDVVERIAASPSRRALTFVDANGIVERVTFAEMARRAACWTQIFDERGLEPGDRVMVVLGKRPEWHSVILGAIKAGLVVVPCSDMLRAGDLAFRAQHSGARLLVSSPGCRREVEAAVELVDRVEVIEVSDEATLLRGYDGIASTCPTVHDDPAFILYTSGTTKEPKGVTHTHAYAYAGRMQAEYWLDARSDDLIWCTAGTGWAKSVWNVLLGPWSVGAEVVLHEGAFDPIERLELIERLAVTVLCQAPTEYRLLAKLEDLHMYDLQRVRHAVSAGEPLNPEVIKAFQEVHDLTIYDGYGQTENSLLVANRRGMELRPGSMGLPTPGHRVAVIDEEGAEVGPGIEGDIALLGTPPTLFTGYWRDPEATLATRRSGWYLTGDRAVVDEDGYLWFAGRADDVILSAAYRIGPFEVESALLEHPAVAESAVVGKPDADRGQLVKAFVVLRPGVAADEALVEELQAHVKSVTAPYKYPREIEFVAALPKTTSGKIRRVELRRLELQRLTGAAESGLGLTGTVVGPVAEIAALDTTRRERDEAARSNRKPKPAKARDTRSTDPGPAEAERAARARVESERR